MELPGNQVPSIDELRKRISTIEQTTPPKIRNLGSLSVSEEELKIRDELEEEVERNLEEEIKGQLCQLSLRLSRLYQRRKERIGERSGHDHRQEKSLSEVKISIRMKGGTTIKINETKIPESLDIKARHHHRVASESGVSHPVAPLSGKSFDWARTLRSS